MPKQTKKKTFKDRILERIHGQRPTTWAQSIGLNSGLINRIFSDGVIPKSTHLITIADALNVSIDWLLTGKEAGLDIYDPKEREDVLRFLKARRNPLTRKAAHAIAESLELLLPDRYTEESEDTTSTESTES